MGDRCLFPGSRLRSGRRDAVPVRRTHPAAGGSLLQFRPEWGWGKQINIHLLLVDISNACGQKYWRVVQLMFNLFANERNFGAARPVLLDSVSRQVMGFAFRCIDVCFIFINCLVLNESSDILSWFIRAAAETVRAAVFSTLHTGFILNLIKLNFIKFYFISLFWARFRFCTAWAHLGCTRLFTSPVLTAEHCWVDSALKLQPPPPPPPLQGGREGGTLFFWSCACSDVTPEWGYRSWFDTIN